MTERPNLLILMADQLRPQALRAYSGQVALTPNIDVLAGEGVVFDDQVGILVKTLEETQLNRNTVICLLADQGDMLGERGFWYKMSFLEPACRIPLIVYAPGLFPAHRVAGSASLLDLLPTMSALAHGGVEPKYAVPIDGKSLLPALTGGRTVGEEVVGEYLAEGAIAPLVMIRRGPYMGSRRAP